MYIEMEVDDEDVANQLQRMMKKTVGHVCSEQCTIENPVAIVILRNSKQMVLWEWNKPNPSDKLIRRINNIYVCKKNKNVHLCTGECENKIMNHEHCLICPISGMQWNNDTERTRSWRNTAKCMPSIATIKSDPNRFCRDVNGSVISGSQNLTMQACKIEVEELFHKMLFSQIRKQSEFSKYLDACSGAHKRINKYSRHCLQNNKPVNISTMTTLYTNAVFKQPNFFRMKQTIDPEDIYKKYTKLLVSYWKILLPSFMFSLFIPSCLYLMRSGVYVNGVPVIERCADLEKILPEASTLDLYGIQKATFTHTKNIILKEIRSNDPKKLHRKIMAFLN